MASCGDCSKSVRKYGAPVFHGVFLDQIVICSHCGWCGVETEIMEIEDQEPIQLDLFGEKVRKI